MKTKCPHCGKTVTISDAFVCCAKQTRTGILTACLACGTNFIVEVD